MAGQSTTQPPSAAGQSTTQPPSAAGQSTTQPPPAAGQYAAHHPVPMAGQGAAHQPPSATQPTAIPRHLSRGDGQVLDCLLLLCVYKCVILSHQQSITSFLHHKGTSASKQAMEQVVHVVM